MNNERIYEIAFHSVGEGGPGGDAITIIYEINGQKVLDIVDCGTIEAGERIVERMQEDHPGLGVRNIVCTHGDQNHLSGLPTIIEELGAQNVYVNFPWHYTDEATSRRLKSNFKTLAEFEKTISNLNVLPAIQGTEVGLFTIMTPSEDRYRELAPVMDEKPSVIGTAISRAAEAVVDLVPDRWDTESLEDAITNPTSNSNESSVVMFAEFGEFRVLLTGDTGIQGLSETADYFEASGIALPIQTTIDNPLIIQIPHHGSRHNISSETLDRLIGERQADINHQRTQYALASVGKHSDTHPRKKTTNAFNRRSCKVLDNSEGRPVVHPARGNTPQARTHDFYGHVEA